MTLLALGMGISFSSLKQGGSSEQSRSLADVLADRLRQARDSAVSRGVPSGIGFSRTGLAQSFYLIEGEKQPRQVGSYRWDREFPQAAAYLGRWPLDVPSQWNPPVQLAASRGLDLGAWAPDRSNDALFVFLPSGRLVSNQPSFDGAQHLVVGTGFAGAPQLTQAQRPFTLTLWPDGEIQLAGGLARGSQVGNGATGLDGLQAVTRWLRPADPPPQIVSVEPCPVPIPETLPVGIDASVSPGGYLTFTAYANDPQGEPLTCNWSTETSGSFSSPQESRMEWDSGLNSWISRWTFTPPPDAQVNQVYTLNCEVSDPNHQTVSKRFGVGGRVLITRKQKLAYVSNQLTGSISRQNLYVCNTDGTERRQLTHLPNLLISPHWTMDGSRILYLSSPAPWPNSFLSLRAVNVDGTNDHLVVDPTGQWSSGIVAALSSFDGQRILMLGSHGNSFDLVSANEDGTNLQVINPTVGPTFASVPPENNGIQMDPNTGNVLICDKDGTYYYVDADARKSYPVNQAAKYTPVEHCFSPDGHWIYFSVGLTTMYRAPFQFDGTQATIGPAELKPAFGVAQTPSAGLMSDTIFYQRDVNATTRRLARYSISQDKAVDLTNNNYFEDDCCVTNFPDLVLP